MDRELSMAWVGADTTARAALWDEFAESQCEYVTSLCRALTELPYNF